MNINTTVDGWLVVPTLIWGFKLHLAVEIAISRMMCRFDESATWFVLEIRWQLGKSDF